MGCGLIAGAIVWLALAEYGALGGIAALLVALASWSLESNIWPETVCWWCRGDSKVSWSWCTPKSWRFCRVCKGSGRRRRILARSR